jgi:hypothetical protein
MLRSLHLLALELFACSLPDFLHLGKISKCVPWPDSKNKISYKTTAAKVKANPVEFFCPVMLLQVHQPWEQL